jgi:hypothetical protein
MTETTVIRVSSLNDYPDCNRRGAARLFWREITGAGFRLVRTARGIGAAVGTAVHRGVAVALDEKARTGILPPKSVATDAGRDALIEQLAQGVQFDGPHGGVTHNRNEAVAQVVGMSSAYHRVIAPQVEPILVEQRLEAEVEPGLVLSGQSDLVCREPDAVRDLKTGQRPPGSFVAQLGGYSLLSRSHGIAIEHASIDFLQRVSMHRAQPDPVTRSASVFLAETAASNILRRIAADIDVFRNGDMQRGIHPGDPWAFLANPSSMLCSARYCPAYGTEFCREGDPDRGQ